MRSVVVPVGVELEAEVPTSGGDWFTIRNDGSGEKTVAFWTGQLIPGGVCFQVYWVL